MILYLTSSPTGDLDGKYRVDGIDNRNGFLDRLKKCWKNPSRCLMITAFPEDIEASEEMTAFFQQAVTKSGLQTSAFDLWDDRTEDTSAEALHSYDVIFLGGGHVPTQNAFFKRLDLRHKIQDYRGIIIGISAGSMNCAEVVYAQPELPGEATDPDYERFITGLKLTDINILPHYQIVKNSVKDGKKLFEDISMPDSQGHYFLTIPDGSYVEIVGNDRNIYGEAWMIHNGRMWQICENGSGTKI